MYACTFSALSYGLYGRVLGIRIADFLHQFNPDQIVFVGDFIDRGPYAKEVVDRIIGLDVQVACLMGNHEMMMLNAVEDMGYGQSPIELWYYNGGEATLQSFGSSSFFSFQSDLEPSYLEFFGEGASALTLGDRATISNMTPEFGATAAMFYIDQIFF